MCVFILSHADYSKSSLVRIAKGEKIVWLSDFYLKTTQFHVGKFGNYGKFLKKREVSLPLYTLTVISVFWLALQKTHHNKILFM